MSAIPSNRTDGYGRAGARILPRTWAVQPYASTDEFVSSILALAAGQTGFRSAFLARPNGDGEQWRVDVAFHAPGGCHIAPGTLFHLPGPNAHNPKLGADGSDAVEAFASISLHDAENVLLGRLCVADPGPRSLPAGAEGALARLGHVLVSHLVLNRRTDALRESDERYRTIVDATAEGIILRDAAGRIVAVNSSGAELIGVPADRLIGRVALPIRHVIVGDDGVPREEKTTPGLHSLRTGEPLTHVLIGLHRPNGGLIWVSTNSRPLIAPGDSRPYAVVTSFVDVTERRRAVDALRESEERFRNAFEHALAGMALTDHAGRFTWVNQSLCRMLGHEHDELLASSFHAILHPDDLDEAQEDSARLFSGELPFYQRERRFLHKDGHVIWGLLSASILLDAQDKPLQVIGQVQDITERKRMEAAVRESDERYRALVSHSSDIITVLDASGVVRSMSEAVERVLGYTPEELIGRTNEELCHSEDRGRLRWTFARCVRSPGVKRQVELRFRHRDGSWRWLEVMTTALLGDPAVGGIVTDARDVTDRRRAAAALQEANTQLERLNQAKSDFVSLVSHEFRTPLTGIRGFSELIRDEDLSIAEIKEFASDINSDAQRLGRLIDQLLDLDRMQSGRIQLQRSLVVLNDLIHDVAQQFRTASSRHHLRLDLDESLPKVFGDRDKLIQVVTNLMSNAIKYSPDGGEVRVVTCSEGNSIRLVVRDGGVGIPAGDLERIFDRYARVEGGAGRFIKGIGLGLPIARQIVELHGGRIWAESDLGQGSSFFVVLPASGSGED